MKIIEAERLANTNNFLTFMHGLFYPQQFSMWRLARSGVLYLTILYGFLQLGFWFSTHHHRALVTNEGPLTILTIIFVVSFIALVTTRVHKLGNTGW